MHCGPWSLSPRPCRTLKFLHPPGDELAIFRDPRTPQSLPHRPPRRRRSCKSCSWCSASSAWSRLLAADTASPFRRGLSVSFVAKAAIRVQRKKLSATAAARPVPLPPLKTARDEEFLPKGISYQTPRHVPHKPGCDTRSSPSCKAILA